jgi:cytochrome c553
MRSLFTRQNLTSGAGVPPAGGRDARPTDWHSFIQGWRGAKIGLGLAAALCLGVPASAQQNPNRPFSGFGGFVERDGAAIFQNVCAGCHMPDAKGAAGAGRYPALAGDEKLATAGYPISLVLHGHKAMPPFADFLDDAQVAAIVTYIRTHFGNDFKDEVTEAEVKAAR